MSELSKRRLKMWIRMLGVTRGKLPRFVRNFMAGQDSIVGAFKAYATTVKDGSFPGPEHCY